MNLLQKMNADEFRKLLEFKEKYPTLGKELVHALTEKAVPIQLTFGECITLQHACEIPYADFACGIFDAFQSKP